MKKDEKGINIFNTKESEGYKFYCCSCKKDLGRSVIPPLVCPYCGKRSCAIDNR